MNHNEGVGSVRLPYSEVSDVSTYVTLDEGDNYLCPAMRGNPPRNLSDTETRVELLAASCYTLN